MKAPRTSDWKDIPKTGAFTTRGASMINLNTGKPVQHYCANTKIEVVQKYVSPTGTYYRTRAAEQHNLNWAFEAVALGLPNEKAPSVPSSKYNSSIKKNPKPATRTKKPVKKQKVSPTIALPKDGGEKRKKGLLRRIFHIGKK